MKKNTRLEIVNSQLIKMTKFVLSCLLMFCAHNISAQMTTTMPGIGNSLVPGDYTGAQSTHIRVDIDGDGVDDFDISNTVVADFGGVDTMGLNGVNDSDNAVLSTTHVSTLFELTDLGLENDVVGAGNSWVTNPDQVMYVVSPLLGNVPTGSWTPGTTGFISVRFGIGGVDHYGYIQVTFNSHSDWIIDGWGYNLTAGADATLVPLGVKTVIPGVGNSLVPGDHAGGQSSNIDVDMDGDGVNDFNVSNTVVADFGSVDTMGLNGVSDPDNAVLSTTHVSTLFELTDLGLENDVVGAGNSWVTNPDQVMYVVSPLLGNVPTGSWTPGTTGAINVRFGISGVDHYGYIQVTFNSHSDWVIDGWGYNQIAGSDATTGLLPLLNILSTAKNEFDSNIIAFAKDNKVTIKNLPEDANYTLYSLTGQSIQEGVAQRDNAEFSVSTIASGIYILKAVGKESGKLLTAKLAF